MTVDGLLHALHQRVSVGDVGEPAPSTSQREALFRAALRAPDHGQLRPWRFLCVEGERRQQLGEILLQAEEYCYGPLTEAQRGKVRQRPLRAPLIVLVITRLQQHPKVPELEQMLSTAAAVQNLLLAAHAQGLGAMWRTGNVTYEPLLAAKLGLTSDERLLGFVYLGTPRGVLKPVPVLDIADFVADWQPPA